MLLYTPLSVNLNGPVNHLDKNHHSRKLSVKTEDTFRRLEGKYL